MVDQPEQNSTTGLDPDVAAWRDAFISANGRHPDVLPQYERGWFTWRHRFGNWLTGRHRRADLREMTKRLQEFAFVAAAKDFASHLDQWEKIKFETESGMVYVSISREELHPDSFTEILDE